MMELLRIAALSATAFAICFAYPTIKETSNEWWRTASVYQVYPLSLKDSNNDGRGDLQGILSKLQYLKDTGIQGVWLSPIYDSPMVDFGYDISNFTNIKDWYGTMDDFDQLVKAMHDLGLKLIMDLVPNHSSDQHVWFTKSVNREPGYENYYVWKNPKGVDSEGNPIPPNNWLSNFRGSAWTYNEQRKQFYLHQFVPQQPDLNYRDPRVVQEMKDVISFWVKKGVDGFRIDAIPCLFEDERFEDEPVHIPPGEDPLDYDYLDHPYTLNQPGTYDMIQQWRELIDQLSAEDGIERVLMAEVYSSIEDTMKYFGTPERPGAHFPFNFRLIDIDAQTTAQEIKSKIDVWIDNLPPYGHSNWVIGNHDRTRVGSKIGADIIDGMNVIVKLLPGTSVTYYGEEIGMVNNYDITYEEGVDPLGCNYPPEQFANRSRDFERTPFQWDNTINAGFNEGGKPWLPVNENYKTLNLEAEKANPYSHYNIYLDLQRARETAAFEFGSLTLNVLGQNTLAILRALNGNDFLIALVNFGQEPEELDLGPVFLLPEGDLTVYTTNAESGLTKGESVGLTNLKLAGRSVVVLSPGSSNLVISS